MTATDVEEQLARLQFLGWHRNGGQVADWLADMGLRPGREGDKLLVWLSRREGEAVARPGDWVQVGPPSLGWRRVRILRGRAR